MPTPTGSRTTRSPARHLAVIGHSARTAQGLTRSAGRAFQRPRNTPAPRRNSSAQADTTRGWPRLSDHFHGDCRHHAVVHPHLSILRRFRFKGHHARTCLHRSGVRRSAPHVSRLGPTRPIAGCARNVASRATQPHLADDERRATHCPARSHTGQSARVLSSRHIISSHARNPLLRPSQHMACPAHRRTAGIIDSPWKLGRHPDPSTPGFRTPGDFSP